MVSWCRGGSGVWSSTGPVDAYWNHPARTCGRRLSGWAAAVLRAERSEGVNIGVSGTHVFVGPGGGLGVAGLGDDAGTGVVVVEDTANYGHYVVLQFPVFTDSADWIHVYGRVNYLLSI